ncbi:hypothetical protein M2459_000457 [Parabacteroides sp. PF5-5]|uniref:DUF3037 domain-containing protein n=1 Tax=unclassified Parabacteroides TaxID=2649774 RepID=UPI002476CE64|nr:MULTISPECIES: DUF3037 domain-containing protein [unclassified Parabacteroides]MDH6303609.1 hypothetical protein [Parabacteroides sp. PH5-39]MDH6314931.1 hypothetical protein [Parabacteroides sp. PF5-13]MDH6318268.1 hypothetical protein [Parabacteroides sp. PH5-13]MDH6321799.1 hypothetical protein [Parabacteroides sp. PH5-8]MDH6325923.1 hypothetical protein [Parabacteroides sp. PH5-41]
MQGMHLYEYAVIRVVPRVEREEFINVGLILFCKKAKYIKAQYELNEKKLSLFPSELDMECLQNSLDAFTKICSGKEAGGTIGSFEIHERFRWLTAVRSSSIQTSRPRTGFSSDLDATFERLYHELVL